MSQPAGQRLFGLDLLRALAIGLVLLCHLTLVFPPSLAPGWFVDATFLGDMGVDLFFGLSGFLIGGILLRDLDRGSSFRGLMSFWSRRWWRTLPNYYLFLGLNLVASRILGHVDPVPLYVAFMQGLWWDPDPRLFHESWSLCVEEWFYLSFALLAFAGARVLRGGRSYLLAALTVAAGSFFARAFLLRSPDCTLDTVRHSTLPRLDSLMFGVIAAYILSRWPARWRAAARPAAAVGLALLVAGFIMRAGLFESGPLTRLVFPDVVALGTALLLPWLSAIQVGAGKAGSFVTSVSLYSYSMYLINIPLAKVLVRPSWVPDRLATAAMLTTAWLVGTYILSGLCYHLYESRMTRLRDADLVGRLRPRPPRFAGPGPHSPSPSTAIESLPRKATPASS
jgi:peptidoglycan/LPS O-acetylase OafA/YrhL